jgi:hypothetical protein
LLIVLHDLAATAAAIVLTFVMRFDDARLWIKLPGLERFLPVFLVYAAAVYFIFGLHRNKWRFTSVPDLYNIFRASTALALSLVALDYVLLSPNVYGQFFFGKITILLYWFLQMALLGGSRMAYRYFHYSRTLQRARIADAAPSLILGRAADAEVLLRSIESGAVRKVWPVGILSPSPNDRGQSIRGIPVLGDIGDLERVVGDLGNHGTRVMRAVLTPSALSPEARAQAGLEPKPVALARFRRTGGAACPGRGRGPAAAAERQDRLRPPRAIHQRQVCRGHRRRRLDRLGNLRTHAGVRRRSPAGAGELRARAARRAGKARRHAGQGRHLRPHRRRARPRAHHDAGEAVQARHRVPRRGLEARAAPGN